MYTRLDTPVVIWPVFMWIYVYTCILPFRCARPPSRGAFQKFCYCVLRRVHVEEISVWFPPDRCAYFLVLLVRTSSKSHFLPLLLNFCGSASQNVTVIKKVANRFDTVFAHLKSFPNSFSTIKLIISSQQNEDTKLLLIKNTTSSPFPWLCVLSWIC